MEQRAHVLLAASLRQRADGASRIAVTAGSVAAVLGELTAKHPRLAEVLFDEHAAPARYLHLFISGDDIARLGGLDAQVGAGDTLTIVPAVAGG